MVATWLKGSGAPSFEQRFAGAAFTPFTNFEGSELDAAISPDGKFVAFLSDRDGPFHALLKQVSTGSIVDLTPGPVDQKNPGPVRSVGFTGDGVRSLAQPAPTADGCRVLPLMGGTPRAFLAEHALNVAWSPDGTQLVYLTYDAGDPLFVADRTGGNARQIFTGEGGLGDHNHFMVWSPDGQWIYFAHSSQSISEFDVWRIPSSGGTPERLTDLHTDIRYLTPIDAGTVLFVAPEKDRSGPWLWALDVERKVAHRVSVGLERYLSVCGQPPMAAASWPPLRNRPPACGACRFSIVSPRRPMLHLIRCRRSGRWRRDSERRSLFYLSSSGAGDGLWRLQDGKPVEIWKGSDGALFEPAGVSPRGDRVVVVLST